MSRDSSGPQPIDAGSPNAGSPNTGSSESLVRVPTRRTPVTPIPSGVRRGGEGTPRLERIPVGTVDSGVLGEVDPAGLVQQAGRSWSIDWWVGAEDRWHHPGMEATVRQGPLEGSPVVETALRVPGGEILQRVGGLQARAGEWSGPAVSIEVENRSAVPVALAVVVRPWQLTAPGRIDVASLEYANDSDQCALVIDGEPAVLFARRPARVVPGSPESVATSLARGEDSEPTPDMGWSADGDGRLELALVFPLAHSATAQLVMPVPSTGAVSSRGNSASSPWRRKRPPTPVTPWSAPPLDAVVAGWALHGEGDPRVVARYDAWSDLVAWSANMIRLAGPAEVTRCLDPTSPPAVGPSSGTRLGAVTEALAGVDAAEINDAIAGALVGAQRFSGAVELADGSDATAALLWSAGAVLLGRQGASSSDALVGPLAKGIRHLCKQVERKGVTGIAGVGPRRCAAALRFAATALVAVEQAEVAEDALVLAAVMIGEPAAAGNTEANNSAFGIALAERDLVAAGSPQGLLGLARRLGERRAGGVPDADGSRATLGFDVAELSETRSAILDSMVSDAPGGPVLLGAWPDAWAGTSLEAHGLPSAWGRVSFALRWHGTRPALLWEVSPAVGSTLGRSAPVLRAPGLAPGWSSTGWSDDSLLPGPGDATPVSEDATVRGDANQRAVQDPVVGEGESFA